MWEYLETFILVFLTDILYTYYVQAINEDRAVVASSWSVVCTLTASIAVINYTENHWTLLASLAGAGAGTYFGIKIKRKQNESSKS
jgi:hypothetical protein